MRRNPTMGWIFVAVGSWYLLSGILTNNMSGLASLGYNPDAQMSIGEAPVRFILGIIINALIIYAGYSAITGTVPPKKD